MTTTQPTEPLPGHEAAIGGEAALPGDEAAVLADISAMIATLLDEYGLDDTEIGMGTTFNDDLELESIDLVHLAGLLETRYGQRVNFAAFIADMELDEIIHLTVGRLVEHVVSSSGSGAGMGAGSGARGVVGGGTG